MLTYPVDTHYLSSQRYYRLLYAGEATQVGVADVDPADLRMETTVGGEVRQEATTAEMHRGPAEAIAALSERVTLRPDDVIAMGSPANPGTIEPGDAVEIRYEGIGTLRNPVVAP